MTATLLVAFLLAKPDETISIVPTDDVWVYQHAPDPATDPFLRAWGSDGRAVPAPGESASASWSLLKFDLRPLADLAPDKLSAAKLVLHLAPNAQLTQTQADKWPLELRLAPAGFEEDSYAFDPAKLLVPSREETSVLGRGKPTIFDNATGPVRFEIPIDLQKLTRAWQNAAATPGQELGLALTTLLDPEVAEDGGIYKVFSTNAPEPKLKPTLLLDLKPYDPR